MSRKTQTGMREFAKDCGGERCEFRLQNKLHAGECHPFIFAELLDLASWQPSVLSCWAS